MKKKIILIISGIVLCLGVIIWANNVSKQKSTDLVSGITPESQVIEKEEVSESVFLNDSESVSTEDVKENDEKIYLNMPCENFNDKSELEIIDCVFISDTKLASHSEYKADYFKGNEVPSVDASQEITYAFLRCKWKNNSDHKINASIDFYGFIEAKDFPYLALSEGLCYFDKPEHISGDDRIHKFFWRTFEAGEELECTIGFAFKEPKDSAFSEKENRNYYIGSQPLGVDYFTLENTKGYIVPLVETGDVDD